MNDCLFDSHSPSERARCRNEFNSIQLSCYSRFNTTVAELEGMDIENAAPEQFEGRIPVKSYHELVAMEQRDAWETLYMELLGIKYAEEDGFRPTDSAYEEMIAGYCKAWRYSDEEARRINSKRMHEISEYASHASEKFYGIIKEKMLKEE